MSEMFRDKCKLLRERLETLCNMLTALKQRIIIRDLSELFNIRITDGRQLVSGIDWLEEVKVEGETLTFINKTKESYWSYVVYTKREYHTVGLGLMYKDNLISPHMDFEVEGIIAKFSLAELDEISELIDETIANINGDIDYLNAHHDEQMHEHYYGEYNSGFDSHHRYETISDVVNDYKSR